MLVRKKVQVAVLLILSLISFIAQGQIPFDTTYTVRNTYGKLIKQYPWIAVAESEGEKVREITNVVYQSIPSTSFGRRDLHADVLFPPAPERFTLRL
jgi:hypothetical protein